MAGIDLFTPATIGRIPLRNRIVMSAMTRSRSPGGVPNELNVRYYAQRAGAGLIMCESTAISARGVGFIDTPGIFTEEQVAGWRRITDAIHAAGGRTILQLWHCGHNSHPSLQPGGALPFGPSAIPAKGSVRTPMGRVPLLTPRELRIDEIPALIEEYRAAARRAMAAGFDGVEVHAGNGYLLDQFLRDSTNRRLDAYGGPVENRRRLLLEVVDAVAGIWGADRVGVRLSPTNPSVYEIRDSDPATLFGAVVEGLDMLGIAFIDVVEGATGNFTAQCDFDFDRLRRLFRGAYIANNGYTLERANRALASGHCDLVAFGRLFVANPDLPRRFALGAPLASVNQDTLYDKGASGYTDYPTIDEEGRRAAG